MNDLISRQALCEYALNQKDKSVTPNDIMRFPPAEPEQRWIPVSEKLPDPDVDVLLQLSDVMATGYYFYDGWHVYFSPKRKDVIAWRELPEPYKGGQE